LRVIRASFLSVVIWLVVVAFGSTMAWVAIDRVGQDLVVADSPIAPGDTGDTGDGADAAGVATADPILPTSSATAPSDGSTADPLGPAQNTSAGGSIGPSGSATSGSSTTASSSSTHPGSNPSTTTQLPSNQGTGGTTQPTVVKRMVRGAAGLISAACEGTKPRVPYASPQDGWALEVYRRPTTVAVAFHREAQDKRGFIVFVGCVKGTPTFVATQRGVSVAPDDIRAVINNRTFLDIASALHWAVAFPNGSGR